MAFFVGEDRGKPELGKGGHSRLSPKGHTLDRWSLSFCLNQQVTAEGSGQIRHEPASGNTQCTKVKLLLNSQKKKTKLSRLDKLSVKGESSRYRKCVHFAPGEICEGGSDGDPGTQVVGGAFSGDLGAQQHQVREGQSPFSSQPALSSIYATSILPPPSSSRSRTTESCGTPGKVKMWDQKLFNKNYWKCSRWQKQSTEPSAGPSWESRGTRCPFIGSPMHTAPPVSPSLPVPHFSCICLSLEDDTSPDLPHRDIIRTLNSRMIGLQKTLEARHSIFHPKKPRGWLRDDHRDIRIPPCFSALYCPFSALFLPLTTPLREALTPRFQQVF